ncbi:MAG TPA: phage tail protein [Tenuifilaceae bacterium]|nr:phage tail protein [Tenuifilaceae bacterium]
MKKNLFCIVALMLSLHVWAQVPQGFSYQAVVRDSEGQPLSNQTVGIRVSLQNEEGNNVYYSETHSQNTSPQGVIAFIVGGGTAVSGDFTSTPWSEENIFLRIEVAPTGGDDYSEIGMVKLQSVPYALFAASGNEGPQGEPGEDGLSAYEVWLNEGNTGSEADFIASLKGETGEAGADGTDGLSAYQVWLAQDNTGSEADFIASLKGETGETGADGTSLEWLGSLPSAPASPQPNQAYYNSTEGVAYVYNGTSWSVLAQDGIDGMGTLPDGVTGQILLHDGTGWTASSDVHLASGDVGIGTVTPGAKLDVVGDIRASGKLVTSSVQVGEPIPDPDQPLFVVRNSNDEIVFAVYEAGVRMYVASDVAKAGSKGGFAVGGLTQSKAGDEYFRVTPDSVRIYIDTTSTAGKTGSKGGFAVGGLTQSKGNPVDLLRVTADSTRIYIETNPAKSGSKGGFAVGGLTQSKLTPSEEYLRITRDSSRIYVNTDPVKAGSKGGFAVGGLTQSKTGENNFMFLTPDNYFIGHEAGSSNTLGMFNSFIGFQAGKSNIEGDENIFIGYQAGLTNEYGIWNTFLGFEAGKMNTGSDNTFIGYKAGSIHQDKGGNVYIGSKAGEEATQGEQNVFIGESAGTKTTIGKKNVFIGYQTGYNSTDAESNVFIGDQAGFTNISGDYNVFLGFNAGKTNSASFNTFLGYQAGFLNTTGQYNSFIGHIAGYSNSIGSSNVFIGDSTGFTNSSGNNNVMIGKNAGLASNGNRNIFIGLNAGKVTSGNDNIFIGLNAGKNFVSGEHNMFIGTNAGFNHTNQNYNLMIGTGTGYSLNSLGNNGSYNSFLGINAGNKIRNSKENAFIGTNAGAMLEDGWSNTIVGICAAEGGAWDPTSYHSGYVTSQNTILGCKAGQRLDVGSGNILIGYMAGYSLIGTVETPASNRLFIHNSSSGSTSALIYGEFDNSILRFNANVGISKVPSYKLDVNGDVNISSGSNFKINGVNLSAANVGAEPTLTKGDLSGTGPISVTSSRQVIGGTTSISIADATTSVKGAVQLSDAYDGTSQTKATTEKALSDGLATKVTGTGMSMGIINIISDGDIITFGDGIYALTWDATNNRIWFEDRTPKGPEVSYWFQGQQGTIVAGDAGIASSPKQLLVEFNPSEKWGYEIHVGETTIGSTYCSVWVQYNNGRLVGHYTKFE